MRLPDTRNPTPEPPAEELLKAFEGDYSASWHYNHAFLIYIKEGPSKSANQLMQKAFDHNHFVPEILLDEDFLSEGMPYTYSPGDKNEALVYIASIVILMNEKKYFNMFDWMIEQYAKFTNVQPVVSGKKISRNAG